MSFMSKEFSNDKGITKDKRILIKLSLMSSKVGIIITLSFYGVKIWTTKIIRERNINGLE